MNRRWPTVVCWILSGLTLAAILADLVAGRFSGWVHGLAGAAALAQLCIPRHTQQAVTAGAVMLAVLAIGFFAANSNAFSPVLLGAFALLVGSRGIARFRLRNHDGPRGFKVLALGSFVFGPGAALLLHTSTISPAPVQPSRALLTILVAILLGALAQLLATPALVKVIPGNPDDERPAVAIWLLLVLWCALRLARGA